MTDKLENELAQGIEEDMAVKAMAQKLAPRPYPEQLRDANTLQPMQKRSMVPVEHFAESLGTLGKTLAELKSLRNKLIGEPGLVAGGEKDSSPAADAVKLPVVGQLHRQAIEVAHLASEMSAVIAQIRDKL